MYASLTGHLPFSGQTLGQLCLALASCRHRPPSSLQPMLPRALDGWFLRALNRDPTQRFDSAKEMALSFASLIPDDDKAVMGIDLGEGTFLSVSDKYLALPDSLVSDPSLLDNTERQFGSSAATIPPGPRRSLSPIIGAAAAVMLTALAVAGFIVMSSPTSGVAASATTGVAAAGVAAGEDASATARAAKPPPAREVISLDDVEDDGEADDVEPTSKKPLVVPIAKRNVAPSRPTKTPEPEAPPPATSKPKAKGNDDGRRTEEDLGF